MVSGVASRLHFLAYFFVVCPVDRLAASQVLVNYYPSRKNRPTELAIPTQEVRQAMSKPYFSLKQNFHLHRVLFSGAGG